MNKPTIDQLELKKLKELHQRCKNSVVEAMVEFPNVAEYIKELEKDRARLYTLNGSM